MDLRHRNFPCCYRWAAVLVAMLMFALVSPARAQLMLNNGAVIVTKPGAFMQVNGAYQNLYGSIDDSGTVTITTDFTNNSTATSSNAGLYNIGGNFTNDGTFNKKTGTVDLYGSSNLNVGGSVITTFYNLQFTGGGSKTLTQKEIVDSNCYFTDGVCYTTQPDVLNFDSVGNWINNSGMPTSSCVSYVSGPCEKLLDSHSATFDGSSNPAFWFPVGKDGRANTCAIFPDELDDNASVTFRTEYFDFSYVDTKDYQSPLTGVSTRQYWHGDIVSNTGDPPSAKIRLYWIPGDYVASWMPSVSNLVVARWDTLAPNPPGPTPAWVTAGVSAVMTGATYNSGWITSSNLSASKYGTDTINRPFTLSSLNNDNSLPVDMGPFTARQVGNAVLLDWQTYSESELRGFEVERIRGANTSNKGADYSTESGSSVIQSFENDTALLAKNPWGASYQTADDNLAGNGTYTYDLYEVDQNGLRTRVGTKTVEFNAIAIPTALTLAAYPNPASHSVQIDFGLPHDAVVSFDLFDVMGRRLLHLPPQSLTAGPHRIPIDISSVADGTYSLQLTAGQEHYCQKLLVIH